MAYDPQIARILSPEPDDSPLAIVGRPVDPWGDEILPDGCAHESVITADGHGAYCRFCGETTA